MGNQKNAKITLVITEGNYMKIAIRKGVFETNSSSNHSLILTNKQNRKKDEEEYFNPKDELFAPFILNINTLETVKDKAIFLAALMDEQVDKFGSYEKEYKLLMKILKEHNEVEILKEIEENKSYYNEHGEPFCTNYYFHNTLSDCTCDLRKAFNKYFGFKSASDILANKDFDFDEFMKISKQIDEEERELREQFEKKLEDFLYGDGVIIAYDEI